MPSSQVYTLVCVFFLHALHVVSDPGNSETTVPRALSEARLDFNLYQDYRWSREGGQAASATVHRMAIDMLRPSMDRRLDGFDEIADALTAQEQGYCVNGLAQGGGFCKEFRAYNPTIVPIKDPQGGFNGGFWVLARISNWSLCNWTGDGRPYSDYPDTRHPHAIFEEYHSHIAMQRFGPRLAPQGPARLINLSRELWDRTRAPFADIVRQGIEDPRAFMTPAGPVVLVTYGAQPGYSDEASCSHSARRLIPEGEEVRTFRQAILSVAFVNDADEQGQQDALTSSDFLTLDVAFDAAAHQKNFMPFEHDGELYAIYQLVPTVKIVHLDQATGESHLAFESESPPELLAITRDRKAVRGGSPVVWVEHERIHLAVAHISRGKNAYTHVFVALSDDKPFDVLAVSGEWCFSHKESFGVGGAVELLCEGVQFVSGLALAGHDSRLVLTFGVNDCDARIVSLTWKQVLEKLRLPKDWKRGRPSRMSNLDTAHFSAQAQESSPEL